MTLTTTEQKSKKKKKSKKKGPAQTSTPDTPTTPVETQDTPDEADERDAGDNDASETEDVPAPAEKSDAPATDAGADTVTTLTNGVGDSAVVEGDDDAAARFDALVKDRDALRAEVTSLRQSLEEIQTKHATEIEAVQTELADTQAEKETAEEQYQSLLGKVNTIRSQLGERLKADAVGVLPSAESQLSLRE